MDNFSQHVIEETKKAFLQFESIDYGFIFGSGTKILLPESDIDILIGGHLTISERIDLAMELELVLRRKIDIVLTKDASPELVLKAFSRGLPVMINNKENLKKDYFENLHVYEDTEGLRKLRISRIKRRYSHGR
jgi:predicted nucleotidyltransferase